MRLMIEILTIYAIYIFGTSLLIWRYGTKDRGPLIVVAAVIPVLTVVSFFEVCIRALFLRTSQMPPCPDGLAEAERIVEKHRQEMFGGPPIPPHIAYEWEMLYAKTLEREAARVQKFAAQILRPA
jgi:hypothetical protein